MDLNLFQNPTRGAFAAALLAFGCAACKENPSELGPVDVGSVTGRVIDRQSLQAIPNARIRIGYLVEQTDAHGAFTLSNVPIGTQSVSVSAIGWEPATVTVVVQKNQTTAIPEPIALVSSIGP